MRKHLPSSLTFGLGFVVAATIIGCAAEHETPNVSEYSPSSVAITQESLEAFESTVYAFGKAKGCVKCHGGSVNPMWLNSDVKAAYSFARNFLDLANPTASTFATYVANKHCGDAVCMDNANIAPMQDLLLQWAEVEINQSTDGLPVSSGTTLANPPYVTQAVAVPANLPLLTSGNTAVIRFNLSQLAPAVPALSNAVLEFSIQAYNSANTTYKIFNPRIAGNTAPVSIHGIHVYIRPAAGSGLGSEFVNGGCVWSSLNAIAAVAGLPSPMPTGPMTSVIPMAGSSLAIPVQSVADVITVGFASVQ